MKRALMYATVASMIDLFNMENIKILQELGYKVDVAANFEEGNITSKERISEFKKELKKVNVNYYHIPIPRSIYDIKSLQKSYDLTTDLKNNNNYDLVHCHTPIGSAICRIAFGNSASRMIYTAHGFHFYKGAPLKNWFVYYSIEKILSKYTDTIITINQEDYTVSKKLYSKKKRYIPGIGINLKKYSEIDSDKIRIFKKQIGLNRGDILLFSIGELNNNKNHEVVLKAIAKTKNKNIHYAIAGQGPLKLDLHKLADALNISSQIYFLGYRKDIPELLSAADIFVFPSLREGLSASLMEAMASGLPVIASDIRGNIDLIDVRKGGYLLNPYDVEGFSGKIIKMYDDSQIRKQFGLYNKNKIKGFSDLKVNNEMVKIYLDN